MNKLGSFRVLPNESRLKKVCAGAILQVEDWV